MARYNCRSPIFNSFLAGPIAPLAISKPRPCETIERSIARNSCLFAIVEAETGFLSQKSLVKRECFSFLPLQEPESRDFLSINPGFLMLPAPPGKTIKPQAECSLGRSN
ncbi:hypothetical protein IQ270_20585 [Microcoleus sp. LEGE 07076]|uniref:hypothetical protein n=1 Tax=Microcoleus sp. LEGE 07076 TaxID=915322 RepID=UPI00187E5701|nr:hypothetical protein [Microcoleus sp. LEGE 07076]MBE9186986.1 hypothetical protein [Microcoleus sp. LEGE 07076]